MIALASLILFGAPVEPPVVGAARVEAPAISRVWLRGAGLDGDALAQAVAARLADKQVLGPGAEAGPIDGPNGGLVALCHVGVEAASLQLEVILSDGRVYQRTIAAPAEGRERTAARLIASTIAAIEDETATPDRRDGVFVAPDAAPIVEAAPLVPETPIVAPPVISTPPREAPVVPAEPPPVKPRAPLELGLALAGGLAFGLGSPAAGLGLAGGGAGVRVDLRLRSGAAIGAGFRGLGHFKKGLGLGRYRGVLVAGYVLRRRALEVSALAGVSLETWQVSEDGVPVAYAAAGPGGASLLIGGLARVAVGGRVVAGRTTSLRLGAFVEAAGSARSSGRAAQIARMHDVAPVFVLGGVELALGLELELWFALRSRQVASRSTVSR